ncbi:uncharacterized protein BDW70DRAFT_135133 [Aspergillus foveolatus]|uniref:uncharacterized protein n=1 Tax=Aspergillus foveolatus TaxID=210207 RepID=UPI003CCD3C7A
MRINWLHRNACESQQRPSCAGIVNLIAEDPLKAQKIQQTIKPAIANKHKLLGAIGNGQKTKYAVNPYLIMITAGLAASMALARAQGLDIEVFGKSLMPVPCRRLNKSSRLPR